MTQNIRELLAQYIERHDGTHNICRMCLGSGAIITDPLGWNPQRKACPECGGSGQQAVN